MTERGGSVVTHETRVREVPCSNPGADQPDWGFFVVFLSRQGRKCWVGFSLPRSIWPLFIKFMYHKIKISELNKWNIGNTYLISLSKFNLPLIGSFYVTHAARTLQSHDLSGEGIKLWITDILFDHIRTWRASPDEWSAQCRGHLRDSTNMLDDIHQAHTQLYQQGEYRMMITTGKWYSGTLWA